MVFVSEVFIVFMSARSHPHTLSKLSTGAQGSSKEYSANPGITL